MAPCDSINRRLSVLESLDLTLPNFSPNDVTFLSELILTMDCLEFCFFDHKNISTRDSGNNRGWFHIALEKEVSSYPSFKSKLGKKGCEPLSTFVEKRIYQKNYLIFQQPSTTLISVTCI